MYFLVKVKVNNKTLKSLSSSAGEVESLNIRLKELIGDNSVRSFGERIDASEGGIRKWLNNISMPSFDKIVRIARECNVTLEWLATGKEPKHPSDQILNDSPHTSVTVEIEEFNEEYVLIPGYQISVSLGHGAINDDTPVKRQLAFRRNWLRFRKLSAGDLAVVFAHGDSMEPTINNGNTILVDMSDKKLKDGSIYVLRFGEYLYAKRLQQRFDGSVCLISDNKEYDDQIVKSDELDQLAIIGKVVWIGKDVY